MSRPGSRARSVTQKWELKLQPVASRNPVSRSIRPGLSERGSFVERVHRPYAKDSRQGCPRVRQIFDSRRASCEPQTERGGIWRRSGRQYFPRGILAKEEDPYRINQMGRKLEEMRIGQLCQKQNGESLSLFYKELIMKTSPQRPVKGRDWEKCPHRTSSEEIMNSKFARSILKKSQKEDPVLSREQLMERIEQLELMEAAGELAADVPEGKESPELRHLEEIRDTRMELDNFLVTNRQSYVRLKDVRNKQYFKPFESKEPFLSLNGKLLGKKAKFSRLKTYTIITNLNS